MNEEETQALAEIREAMQSYDWRLEAVLTFTHGVAVQVYAKKASADRRYKKVGPMIFPNEGETVADVLALLGSLAVDKEGVDG